MFSLLSESKTGILNIAGFKYSWHKFEFNMFTVRQFAISTIADLFSSWSAQTYYCVFTYEQKGASDDWRIESVFVAKLPIVKINLTRLSVVRVASY